MTAVSVVIPTRDRPELLEVTLRSVLWQTLADIEVLVVDDGAGPDTRVRVERLSDPRMRWMRNAGPPGVSSARNAGIAAAAGRWVAFLDDDDLWAPDKLAAQVALAERDRVGWVYAGDVTVDETLRVRDGAPPPAPVQVVAELRRFNAVPAGASNVIVRREVLGRVGGFDPELRTSEDWDLWLRLAAVDVPSCVPRPMVALRTHPGSASRAVDRMLADIEVIARRHRIPVDRARHQRWAAWRYLEEGQRGLALRHYAGAVRAGDVASVARAAVALIYPQIAQRRRAPSDSWAREAQVWLNAVGEATTSLAADAARLSSGAVNREARSG